MSAFTDPEISYMKTQRLGRLATVGADGQPHVVPVSFHHNQKEDAIEIGGNNCFAKRKKYWDVVHNPRVALEIDAVSESLDGARIEIRGQARVLMTGGTELRPGFDDEMLRARQSRIITWGVNSKDFIQQDAQSVA